MSNTVFSNPALFGFSDMEPCLTFDVTGEARCAKPSSKFFWDGIHPTRTGHALIAQQALQLIGSP